MIKSGVYHAPRSGYYFGIYSLKRACRVRLKEWGMFSLEIRREVITFFKSCHMEEGKDLLSTVPKCKTRPNGFKCFRG